MSGFDEVWGDDHDDAWGEFAGAVSTALEHDGFGIVEVEVLTAGDEVDGCRPWVTVAEDDGAYAAGVSGNDLLAAEHRLDARQQAQLHEMGFREAELGAAGERWFRREAGPDDLDLLVGLLVRALREVFGVLHPAFLEWDGQDQAPAGGDARRYPPRPRPGLAWPTSAQDLTELVDAVVGDWLGHEPFKDDDGDIPVVRGESMLFVQVAPGRPRVDLFSVVVRDLRHRGAARREVNLLNRTHPGQTFWISGDRVMMRHSVPAEPFVAAHLVAALDQMCRTLDCVAGELAERVGGVPFLADDSEGVP